MSEETTKETIVDPTLVTSTDEVVPAVEVEEKIDEDAPAEDPPKPASKSKPKAKSKSKSTSSSKEEDVEVYLPLGVNVSGKYVVYGTENGIVYTVAVTDWQRNAGRVQTLNTEVLSPVKTKKQLESLLGPWKKIVSRFPVKGFAESE